MHVCGSVVFCEGGRLVQFVTPLRVISIYYIISCTNYLYNTKTMSTHKLIHKKIKLQ